MYHGLGGPDGVDPDAFERQLDALTARRRVLSLRDVLKEIDRPAAAGLAAITFDDGYRDFAEIAAPRLDARSLHATLFVPAGRIGGYNDWDEGIFARREILTAAELRALDPKVVEIGAHGHDHRRLSGLAAPVLRHETRDARARLEEAVGRPVELFAYPYGQWDDFDDAAEAAVAEAGFLAACSTCFGRGSRPADRFRLRRVGVEPHDTLAAVEAKLDGGYDFVAWKERVGTGVRRLRRGLGA
jgi:peptidoglycan/xylan/chitin deacetylase (PgdA/CDA1 family)